MILAFKLGCFRIFTHSSRSLIPLDFMWFVYVNLQILHIKSIHRILKKLSTLINLRLILTIISIKVIVLNDNKLN